MAAEDDNTPSQGGGNNQGGGNTWDSLMNQIKGEQNKALKDKAKGKLKALMEERAKLQRSMSQNDEKIAALKDAYESGEIPD